MAYKIWNVVKSETSLTFAFPWKLNVSTNSPFRVSLCLTRKTPWPVAPPVSTSWAASDRGSVPWNHGYSRNEVERSNSGSVTTASITQKWKKTSSKWGYQWQLYIKITTIFNINIVHINIWIGLDSRNISCELNFRQQNLWHETLIQPCSSSGWDVHSSKLLLLDNLRPGVSLPAGRDPAVPCSLGGSSGGCSWPTAPTSAPASNGLFPPRSTRPRSLSPSLPPAAKLLL